MAIYPTLPLCPGFENPADCTFICIGHGIWATAWQLNITSAPNRSVHKGITMNFWWCGAGSIKSMVLCHGAYGGSIGDPAWFNQGKTYGIIWSSQVRWETHMKLGFLSRELQCKSTRGHPCVRNIARNGCNRIPPKWEVFSWPIFKNNEERLYDELFSWLINTASPFIAKKYSIEVAIWI